MLLPFISSHFPYSYRRYYLRPDLYTYRTQKWISPLLNIRWCCCCCGCSCWMLFFFSTFWYVFMIYMNTELLNVQNSIATFAINALIYNNNTWHGICKKKKRERETEWKQRKMESKWRRARNVEKLCGIVRLKQISTPYYCSTLLLCILIKWRRRRSCWRQNDTKW